MGVILAMALLALTLVNWVERGRFGVPEVGVSWVSTESGVVADAVEAESPAALVGVRPGDTLRSIAGRQVREIADVARTLAGDRSAGPVEYAVVREGKVVALRIAMSASTDRDPLARFLMALGWGCALIGLLVWTRTPLSPMSGRFFAWCLASLAVFSLSASGRLEGIDRLVYWIDVWALLLMPPLLLDFLLRFPGGRLRRRSLATGFYGLAVATGAAHHAAAGRWVSGNLSEEALLQFFDTVPLVLLVASALAAASVWRELRDSSGPVERQQLRWIGFGGVASIVPFGTVYIVPFALGSAPGPSEAFSVLSLAAMPAGCAVALFQYRLLDFEPLWRRTMASSAAACCLIAVGFGVLQAGIIPGVWLERYAPVVWILSLAVASAAFGPMRDWLVDRLERRAYRGRYDERRTLAEFARELAAETDPDRMLAKVGDRLASSLRLERVAILAPERGPGDAPTGRFRSLWSQDSGPSGWQGARTVPALAGASEGLAVADPHRPSPKLRAGEDRGEFWHYVPCILRGDTLAWIALGRGRDSSLLSSEDLALVETVACPLAIALENARLYRSLREEAAGHQRLKEFNENIVESLAVGIIVTDTRGRVLSWNSQLELSLQIPREQATGRPLAELLPPAFVETVESCAGESGSGSVDRFTLRARDFPPEFRPQGRHSRVERIVSLAVAPLVSKDFRDIGQLLIVDDISERVELERAVRQADRLTSVGLLAAGVAHEVNTPLAVISSYAQILGERLGHGSDEARMLGKVTEQTFRASEIVNSLLDFSRTSQTHMGPCDLDATIRDTLDLVRPQLAKAGVRVEASLCGAARVTGNSGRLQQVLLNLFLNAKDAMPGGGSLRVSSEVEGAGGTPRSVRVRVADSGKGMATDVRRKIFDPFFTTKAAGRGTGLGLAVAYGIVQDHAGQISVFSEPGQGTVFMLEFPLAERPVHA